jgi:hypothetical protein
MASFFTKAFCNLFGGVIMRSRIFCLFLSLLVTASSAWSQQPPSPAKVDPVKEASADTALKDLFDSKIKAEWDAIKNKDRKAYNDLLDDEYQGVETDGQGERNKIQAINELVATNVFSYTLWGLKVTPLGPDATFVVYEVTMQFPPKSAVRLSRIYIGSLWVKRSGQWKELHYQETHVK